MFEMAFYAYNYSDELEKRQGYAAASQRAKHGTSTTNTTQLPIGSSLAPNDGHMQRVGIRRRPV